MSSVFEPVGYATLSGSLNSVKIIMTKDVKPGDHLCLSVKETQRILKERWLSAKLYRVNHKGIPEQTIREAEPEKLKFSLNLF